MTKQQDKETWIEARRNKLLRGVERLREGRFLARAYDAMVADWRSTGPVFRTRRPLIEHGESDEQLLARELIRV